MELVSVSLKEANQFVEKLHRHHKKVQGHKFSIGAKVNGELVGIAIVGRPVARGLDDGTRLEVTRLCTNGYRNACSFLYGATARAAWALGYKSIGTYILEEELGSSLEASGFKFQHTTKGRSWSCPSRIRTDKHPTVNKKYYLRTKE